MPTDNRDEPAAGASKAAPKPALALIEHVDYTVEQGRWVFSRAYLLRRGTCCGSGCRHCPYGGKGDAAARK